MKKNVELKCKLNFLTYILGPRFCKIMNTASAFSGINASTEIISLMLIPLLRRLS
jgi:hypothetical protein